ncbi:Nitric oxide dioxygenase [Globisporangium polare]
MVATASAATTEPVVVAPTTTSSSTSSAPTNNTTTAPAKRVWPRSMSPATVELLKATAPVVKEHGTAITSTMYKTMFATYPEVKNLFNMTHHRVKSESGESTSQQARSLANAVFAFAANADRLANLTDAVARMVHKHVSLDIRAEHYPIVGTCLLGAIKTVLGDAATPDIMAAWEDGYFFLADLLIAAETQAREELEAQAGGWSGFRQLRVDKKVRESAEITSFYLVSADASVPLVPFKPGQYLSLKLDALQENVLLRNYSLSSAPSTDFYRISVKKEDRGDGSPKGVVSCHLHDAIEEGSAVLVGPPCGDFVLKESNGKPLVFLSGGVGVTPLLSMLESLVDSVGKKTLTQRVVFVQYARNADVLAFGDHLAALADKHELLSVHTVLASGSSSNGNGGQFDLNALEAWLPTKDCAFYFCGPAAFMTSVNKALATEWDVPAAQRHYEYFGPTQDIDASA